MKSFHFLSWVFTAFPLDEKYYLRHVTLKGIRDLDLSMLIHDKGNEKVQQSAGESPFPYYT